jgi:short subunit dehydrogenase-like uncharacterized protein
MSTLACREIAEKAGRAGLWQCLRRRGSKRLTHSGVSSFWQTVPWNCTTMVENLHRGGLVRRSGRLVAVPSAARVKELDFGYGQIKTMSIPWGDLSTAWVSTAIPNIEVYMVAPMGLRCCQRHQGTSAKYWQHPGYRTTSNEKLTRDHPAPTRCNGVVVFRASGRNAAGQSMISR